MPDRLHLRLTYIIPNPRLRPTNFRESAALVRSNDMRRNVTKAVHHPGEVLAHKLEAVGVSPTELARQLHVPANRITQIINGKRGITGDSALRLAHWFGNEPEFWMNLQVRYDLEIAEAETGQEIHGLPIFTPTASATESRPVGAQKAEARRMKTDPDNQFKTSRR